ncbi:tyrosine-type recombinase/integrase [Thermodesulfobacteriota bacterium]
MGVRKIGGRFYVYFNWKGNRLQTVTSAVNEAEAKRIERSVKTAFNIYRFDHLEPKALEVTLKIFETKGWKLPDELATPEPEIEMTLFQGIKDYLDAADRNRTVRKVFAIDRIVEYFGDGTPMEDITVLSVRKYRDHRLAQGVTNGTVNIEVSTLSGIFRVQLEKRTLEFNPCSMVSRLPETQRDVYISWDEFQQMLEVAGWLKTIITILYYTGMRPSEVFELDWKEVDFGRRMIVLPPTRTKEGKNAKQKWLREKRVPMRMEVHDLLWAMRHEDGDNVVRLRGPVFTHEGRPITRSTKRKCWARIIRLTGLDGYQMRDFRRAFKTNLAWSGIDRTIRNAIVGHSSHVPVEDRYIHLTDERLLEAVDSMRFDHGADLAKAGEISKVTKE